MSDPQALYEAINTETSEVLVGYDDVIRKITIAILINGHILLRESLALQKQLLLACSRVSVTSNTNEYR